MKRLIRTDMEVSRDAFPDYLYVIMMNIEDAFLLADAEPGEDYSYKDLMELAIKIYQTDNPDNLVHTMPSVPTNYK